MQEAVQFVGDLLCGLVTAMRILLHAFQADGLEIARHTRIEQSWLDRLFLDHLCERVLDRMRQKWRAASKQMVQDSS